jgi:4-amino-4-deoxy-L-arabinose transferase-like glycosyltransferase
MLSRNFFLILILLGSSFVAISLGNYAGEDSKLEYNAAMGVVKWGYPYITFGNLINQPPLGYYIDSVFFLFFGIFGVTDKANQFYGIGVGIVTMFGLGCVFLVYELGRKLYGEKTGFVAAALFGLTPWHVVMSTTFLIDAQCLFLSLLFLLVGILAIRKGSQKLFLLTGVLFGLALLTKIFAVFFVIPLLIIFISSRPKKALNAIKAIALFVSPAFLMNFLWYNVLTNLGLDFVLHHDDFLPKIPVGIVPSPFFIIHYLSDNLSVALLIACALSLFLSIYQKDLLKRFLTSDISIVITLLLVSGIEMYLVLGRNLLLPFVNLLKYAYLLVPLFCLLAASLADKCILAYQNSLKSEAKPKMAFSVALIGLTLLAITIANYLIDLNMLIAKEIITFSAGGGFSIILRKVGTIAGNTYLILIQCAGFALILCSLAIATLKIQENKEPQRNG